MVDEGLMKGLGAQGPFCRVVKVSGYSGRDRTCQSRLTNRTSETTLSRNLFRVGAFGHLTGVNLACGGSIVASASGAFICLPPLAMGF